MKNILILLGVLVASLLNASAVTYTGILSAADGGLVATGPWQTSVLSWTVTNENSTGLVGATWSYNYTFVVPEKAISHFVIETSPSFTTLNILDILSVQNSFNVEVGTFVPNNSNPGMPGNIYGMKFDTLYGLTTLNISFLSDREPVWGNMYAKDGVEKEIDGINEVYAYNAGFLDPTPTGPASNGSLGFHLLVPDTIPETETALLGGLGLLMLLRLRRR